MSEEAAFIAALVADPSDRTTALVFADWLDDRDDPRGLMMRNDTVRAWMAPTYENPLPKLLKAIETGKGVTKASRILAMIGETTVPELLSLLKHEKPLVRLRAIKALRLMGTKAKAAIPALTEIVKGSNAENADVRSEAAKILGVLRVKKVAKDELAKGLDSADPDERLAAVEAMAKLRTRTAADALCKALADESVGVRIAAVQQLCYIASPSMTVAVEPLRRALADQNAAVRRSAVAVLGRIGPKAAAAVPDLLRRWHDATTTERPDLIEALAQIGVGIPEVLEVLLASLRESNTRMRSLTVLTKWPTIPNSAAPALLELVRNPNSGSPHTDANLIRIGLHVLARINPLPPDVVKEFRSQLAKNHNAYTVAQALEQPGVQIVPLLPDLITVFHRLGKNNDGNCYAVARVIGKLGGDGIAELAKLLDHTPTKNNFIPAAAAAGLAAAGDAARPVLPEMLAQFARLRKQNVACSFVINALAAIGADAAVVVPDLVAMFLDDNDSKLHPSYYANVLQRFGPAVLPLTPRLTAALRQPASAEKHTGIIELLAALIPHGYDAFPVLQEALRRAIAVDGYGGDDYRRLAAVRAAAAGLAKLGSKAEAAVPDLLLADQTFANAYLSLGILAALGEIGGEAAVSHIRAALNHRANDVRLAAIEALGASRDKSAETQDALRTLETDSNKQIRVRVASLLRKM